MHILVGLMDRDDIGVASMTGPSWRALQTIQLSNPARPTRNGGIASNNPPGTRTSRLQPARVNAVLERLADEQEPLEGARHDPGSGQQVSAKDDVAIDERPERAAGDAVDESEGRVEPRRSARSQRKTAYVLRAELARRVLDSRFVPEQHDLHVECQPALDRATLDHADLSLDAFGTEKSVSTGRAPRTGAPSAGHACVEVEIRVDLTVEPEACSGVGSGRLTHPCAALRIVEQIVERAREGLDVARLDEDAGVLR